MLNIVLYPLKSIIQPLINIGKLIVSLFEIILKIILMIPKIFSIFEIITDPAKVIKDILWGIIEGIKLIFNSLVEALVGKVNNTISLSGVGGQSKGQACFDPSLTNIILLVLCPSLSLTLNKGIKKFHLIIICAILSYFYYFPGLIYASLYIL